MKKLLQCFILLGFVAICLSTNMIHVNASENSKITVRVDELSIDFEVEPLIVKGNMFVQFKPLFEGLGYEVKWDKNTQAINCKKEDSKVNFQVNSKEIYIDDKKKTLNLAPKKIDGIIFIPLRNVCETLDKKVLWNKYTRTVDVLDECKGVFYREFDISLPIKPLGLYDDFIYYYDTNYITKVEKLMRCKKDGSNKEIIIDDNIDEQDYTFNNEEFLDIYNDKMYVTIDTILYQSDVKYKNKKVISDNLPKWHKYFKIIDNKVYFTETNIDKGDDYQILYSIDLDGNNKMKLLETDEYMAINNLVKYKNKLYFCTEHTMYGTDKSMRAKLYRIETDGSNAIALPAEVYRCSRINEPRFIIDNDWIYYINPYESQVYRLNINNNKKEKLTSVDNSTYSDNVTLSIKFINDGYVYFDHLILKDTEYSPNTICREFYRVNTDGINIELFTEDYSWNIQKKFKSSLFYLTANSGYTKNYIVIYNLTTNEKKTYKLEKGRVDWYDITGNSIYYQRGRSVYKNTLDLTNEEKIINYVR